MLYYVTPTDPNKKITHIRLGFDWIDTGTSNRKNYGILRNQRTNARLLVGFNAFEMRHEAIAMATLMRMRKVATLKRSIGKMMDVNYEKHIVDPK